MLVLDISIVMVLFLFYCFLVCLLFFECFLRTLFWGVGVWEVLAILGFGGLGFGGLDV